MIISELATELSLRNSDLTILMRGMNPGQQNIDEHLSLHQDDETVIRYIYDNYTHK